MSVTARESTPQASPEEIGRRIRAARLAAGLSQLDLAGTEMSGPSLSRFEAGERRPRPELLAVLAHRLRTTVEELTSAKAPSDARLARQVDVEQAELALACGDVDAAADLAHTVLDNPATPRDLLDRATLTLALVKEAHGDLHGAILDLEDLLATDPDGQAAIGIALSRCYRETGSFTRAIESGEAILTRLTTRGQAGLEDHIRLTLTVAGAYLYGGDVGTALRLCRRSVLAAEELGSAEAKAAAYWNSSVMERASGNLPEALRLATLALAIQEHAQGNRNLAQLRTWMGLLTLTISPPDAESALGHLQLAARELEWAAASPADIVRNGIWLARAYLVLEEFASASRELLRLQNGDLAAGLPALMTAEIHVVQAHVQDATGEPDSAALSCESARRDLDQAGSERDAAQLWFELGDVLNALGNLSASNSAYRRSAAILGVDRMVPPRRGITVTTA